MRAQVRPTDFGGILVALLVVLAGCNGLVPGGSEPTPAETVTPVPIENGTQTATATPEPAEFDWLVTDGIVDLDPLYVEHTEHLSNTTYTLIWNKQAVGGSGPIAASFDRRIAVVNDTTYSRRDTGSSVDGTVRIYSDPSGLYRSVEAPNGSTRNLTSPDNADGVRRAFALLAASTVDRLFVEPDARIGFTERDGTRYARLVSTTTPDYLHSVYTNYDVRNFTMTVWVHPDRYVRTTYHEFTLVDDEERVTIGVRYTFTDVGETTVDQPPWVRDLEIDGTRTPTPGGNATAGNDTTGNGTNGNGTAGNDTTGNGTAGTATAGTASPGTATDGTATAESGPAGHGTPTPDVTAMTAKGARSATPEVERAVAPTGADSGRLPEQASAPVAPTADSRPVASSVGERTAVRRSG